MRSSVEPQLLYEYPWGHEPGSGGKVYPEPVFQVRCIPLLTLQENPAGILIEIQLVTEGDQLFNEWMHAYFYKYVNNYSVGLFLRRLYEQHIINTEEDFRKEMSKYVLFDCKKI